MIYPSEVAMYSYLRQLGCISTTRVYFPSL